MSVSLLACKLLEGKDTFISSLGPQCPAQGLVLVMMVELLPFLDTLVGSDFCLLDKSSCVHTYHLLATLLK